LQFPKKQEKAKRKEKKGRDNMVKKKGTKKKGLLDLVADMSQNGKRKNYTMKPPQLTIGPLYSQKPTRIKKAPWNTAQRKRTGRRANANPFNIKMSQRASFVPLMKRVPPSKRTRGLFDQPIMRANVARPLHFPNKKPARRSRGLFDQPMMRGKTVKPLSLMNYNVVKPQTKNNLHNLFFEKKPARKDKTYQQAWRKNRLTPFLDYDGDGVINIFDCKPYDKTRQDDDSRRRAMFRSMKERGTYDPAMDPTSQLRRTGKPSKEDKKWMVWIAKGRKGPSPWDKAVKELNKLEPGDIIAKARPKKLTKTEIDEINEALDETLDIEMKAAIDAFKKQQVVSVRQDQPNADLKRKPAGSLYKRLKGYAIREFKKQGKKIPPEDSIEFRKEVVLQRAVMDKVEDDYIFYGKVVPQTKKDQIRKRIKKQIDDDEETLREKFKRTPRSMRGIAIEEGKKATIKLTKPSQVDVLKSVIAAEQKKKRKKERKKANELAEELAKRREERSKILREAIREREKILREEKIERSRKKREQKDDDPFGIKDRVLERDQKEESPAARMKRLAREAQAKTEAKKAKKIWGKEGKV
jgi:hypothetical protein